MSVAALCEGSLSRILHRDRHGDAPMVRKVEDGENRVLGPQPVPVLWYLYHYSPRKRAQPQPVA